MEVLLEAMLRWLIASVAATETVLLALAVVVILYGMVYSHVPDNKEKH